MNRLAAIRGSGKIAGDICGLLIEHGWDISWLCTNEESRARAQMMFEKAVRRFSRAGAQYQGKSEYHVLPFNMQVRADVCIECSHEDLSAKQHALAGILPFLPESALILSTSSSILPSDIHPRCAGMHLFFPAQLTRFAEIIFPSEFSDTHKSAVREFMHALRISFIEQSPSNAFGANRLMLPLQAHTLRLLDQGYPPDEIDLWSMCGIFPHGQCTLMDSVGAEIMYASVQNYCSRMSESAACEYYPLKAGLKRLSDYRNNAGQSAARISDLYHGNAASVENPLLQNEFQEQLMRALFINTCHEFIATSQMSRSDLDMVLAHAFQSDISAAELLCPESARAAFNVLETEYSRCGISLYKPCSSLKDIACAHQNH